MVVHYSISDGGGGAGIAALGIHNALRKAGYESRMVVEYKTSQDPDIREIRSRLVDICKIKRGCARLVLKLDRTKRSGYHSLALFSGRSGRLVKTERCLIHLHWVQGEMLRIEDIGAIKRPFVWTLHDSWPLSGCEHLLDSQTEERIRQEYKNSTCSWPDLSRWCYERKKKWLSSRGILVSPSSWLAEKAEKSALFSNWEVRTVPNVVDGDLFRPEERDDFRRRHCIDKEEKVVLVVSAWGDKDENKRIENVGGMTQKLAEELGKPVRIVVIGNTREQIVHAGYNAIIDYRKKAKRSEMPRWYSASDCVIVGSRVESFGLAAAEASLCERPVVCWDTSGLKDVVVDRVSGVRVPVDHVGEFREAVKEILEDTEKARRYGKEGRRRGLLLWNEETVARQYMEVYKECMAIEQVGLRA